ncbi:hypothetical protein SAMN02910371_00562 [Butyrivibrio sp. INlla14]|nr:hypothetical protein SAMN02910371_00562 [Butyrivibrio sp. INlla14]
MDTISGKSSDDVKTERTKDSKTAQSKTVHEANDTRGYLLGTHVGR